MPFFFCRSCKYASKKPPALPEDIYSVGAVRLRTALVLCGIGCLRRAAGAEFARSHARLRLEEPCEVVRRLKIQAVRHLCHGVICFQQQPLCFGKALPDQIPFERGAGVCMKHGGKIFFFFFEFARDVPHFHVGKAVEKYKLLYPFAQLLRRGVHSVLPFVGRGLGGEFEQKFGRKI